MPNLIGDWLEQTKESQPTVMDNLSLIGDWVNNQAKKVAPMFFPSEWERYSEMEPLQRQGQIAKEAVGLNNPVIGSAKLGRSVIDILSDVEKRAISRDTALYLKEGGLEKLDPNSRTDFIKKTVDWAFGLTQNKTPWAKDYSPVGDVLPPITERIKNVIRNTLNADDIETASALRYYKRLDPEQWNRYPTRITEPLTEWENSLLGGQFKKKPPKEISGR